MEENKSITADQIMEAIYNARKKYERVFYSRVNPKNALDELLIIKSKDFKDIQDDEYKYPITVNPYALI